jgi:2-C-methyl-D-erythritol 4-phosphate cytidylyltransferase/2-C-methyl-D-erythritol 4-phosphate cytidylyltransferase/2-C-methyl-D-erythritol 2,4-cyclodiphosphate synthase
VPASRCAAVVTAAGASTRIGGTKKEFRAIGGVPVLALAVRPFLAAGMVRVVVTLPAGKIDEAAALLAPHVDIAALVLVEGGGTRQESVRRGLLALADDPPDLVLIHDGARPWLAPELLGRVRDAAARFGACVPVVEVTEAVKELDPAAPGADAPPLVLRHVPRQRLRFAQTPQGFSYPRILAAHQQALAKGLSFVDDAEVFDRFDGPVAWVSGDWANRKITFAEDLEEGAWKVRPRS